MNRKNICNLIVLVLFLIVPACEQTQQVQVFESLAFPTNSNTPGKTLTPAPPKTNISLTPSASTTEDLDDKLSSRMTEDAEFKITQESTEYAAMVSTYESLEATRDYFLTTTPTPTPSLAPIATLAEENLLYGISAEELIRRIDQNLSNLSTLSYTTQLERYVWFEGASYVSYLLANQTCQIQIPEKVSCSSERTYNDIHLLTNEYGEPETERYKSFFENDKAWVKWEDEDWELCDDCNNITSGEELISFFSISQFVSSARYANYFDVNDPFEYVSGLYINPSDYITQKLSPSTELDDKAQIVFSVDPYIYNQYVFSTNFDELNIIFDRGSVLIDLSSNQYVESSIQLIFKNPIPDDSAGRNYHIEISDYNHWYAYNEPFIDPEINE